MNVNSTRAVLSLYLLHFSKGLLFLCHGYGEHLEWYGELAAHLASEKHLLVFGHDHIGHGLSDGERAVVDDLDEVYVNDVFLHVFTVRALVNFGANLTRLKDFVVQKWSTFVHVLQYVLFEI